MGLTTFIAFYIYLSLVSDFTFGNLIMLLIKEHKALILIVQLDFVL
jgi:hypothetical protein